MLAAKTKELEEEEEGREAMEVEEERAKVIVMEVEEEKVGTATGEVCDTEEEEEEAVPLCSGLSALQRLIRFPPCSG